MESEYGAQVRAIAARLRELNNPQLNGWDQRPGYCKRTYGTFFDTKDIRRGSTNSNAPGCAVECDNDAECYGFFLNNNGQCMKWINVDISVQGEDDHNGAGCFHLNNCYVRLTGEKAQVEFRMGASAEVPAGFRDVCMDELVDDMSLWRAAKDHLDQV